MREANGPAINVPNSMTFRPESGLAVNGMLDPVGQILSEGGVLA
jgi:hypothetical protein